MGYSEPPLKSSPFNRLLSDHPLLRLLLPFMLGIWLGENVYSSLAAYCLPIAVLALVLIAYLAFCEFCRPRILLRGFLFLCLTNLLAGLLGCLLLLATRHGEVVNWSDTAQAYRAQLVEPISHNGRVAQSVVKLQGGEHSGRKVRLALEGSRVAALQPGDVILFKARISHPKNYGNPEEFNYVRWLRRCGIDGVAYCAGPNWQCSSSPGHLSLPLRMLRLREELVDEYADYFQGRTLAVLSALTLGDKTQLDSSTRELFSQGGVSHVLALSGLHLGILFTLYQILVLSLCRRRMLYLTFSLLGVLGLWMFVLLAGSPISLIRAAVMFSVMQLAGCLRRDSLSVNNLALAAFVLLLSNPQTLFDVGFQLSCLSVLFILLFVPRFPIPRWVASHRPLRWVYAMFTVSLCAQIGTAPLVAHYFQVFPLYALLVNLVVVPMAYLVLSGALLFFLLPFLRGLVAAVLDYTLTAMEVVLQQVASWPAAVCKIYLDEWQVLLLYVLIFSVAAYYFSRRAKPFYLICAALLSLGCYTIVVNGPSRVSPCLVFYHLRSATAVHCIVSAKESYIFTPDSAACDTALQYVRKTFWEKKHMAAPRWLTASEQRRNVAFVGGVLSFGGKRVAIPAIGLSKSPPEQPLPVDYLLLSGKDFFNLSQLLLYYEPQQVVLDATLHYARAKRYSEWAAALGLPVYNVREQGALVCPLNL